MINGWTVEAMTRSVTERMIILVGRLDKSVTETINKLVAAAERINKSVTKRLGTDRRQEGLTNRWREG